MKPDGEPTELDATQSSSRIPLERWALRLARRWNSGTCSLFVLHGNIFDLFPWSNSDSTLGYVPLTGFIAKRLFPDREFLLFYDIGNGLSFGQSAMQRRFFDWLEVYDRTEGTAYHRQGLPRDFIQLAPILRRFWLSQEDSGHPRAVTLVIEFPEKIIPAAEEAYASREERMALVTLLRWAASAELRHVDLAILLITESAAELHADLLRSPHVEVIRIELPESQERLNFVQFETDRLFRSGPAFTRSDSDLSDEQLAERTGGLSRLQIRNVLAEAIRNGRHLTFDHLSEQKRRVIEDYCQGLVRFKEPRPGLTLDSVATHRVAKKRLRELAWLIRNGKSEVLERGVLVPGRVGVGKSFLVECFASECGLPVMEIGEFRSKWVGDTERQLSRILITIRGLGPVVVVVDEADAVFGSRETGGDSGVSGRVFAAFAAHIGDSSLRGRELWIAMTSRPDLLAVDMKRQGRFGLCIPLFPAQTPDEVEELFSTIAAAKRIELSEATLQFIRRRFGNEHPTGSEVEAILMRAKEASVLAGRNDAVRVEDLEQAIESYIDPLDPDLLALQELAAVMACSDRRCLPERYGKVDRAALRREFDVRRHRTEGRVS